MDHNLDDSLNLESAMGVDFEHSEDSVVNQEDIISLQTGGSEQNIPMEFQPIEEQPMLMDTGSEEIIVSDFMGDQFALQEYEVPDDQVSNLTTTVEANNQLTISSQAEGLGGLQLEPQTIKVTLGNTMQEPKMTQAKVISVKAAAPNLRPIAPKKETIVLTKSVAPRQIAIAPKPYKLAETSFKNVAAGPPKQFAIAPKPVAMVANKSVSLVKKLPDGSKGTVLAQIGKQLVMVPTSGAQKIKLVTAGPGVPPVRLLGTADAEQAQLIAQSLSGSQNNQRLTKVIVQGGGESGAVLTRLGAPPGRLLAVQQRNVPISIGHNKVLVTSPTKSGIKFTKKQQLIAIKSPNTKILPATTAQGSPTTKKVVITANPPQNMILKTTAPPKVGHITKVGQRTQVHQINVPGKGIQYIRLVTNPTPKPAPKPPLTPTAGKTYVLSDSKGNFIQMSSDKMTQPPPLLVTNVSSSNKSSLSFNPQQKLVRIAPIPAKPQQTQMQQQPRGGQSLLAPLSPTPAPDAQAALIDEMSKLLEADPVSEQVVEEPEGKPDINNIAQMEETVEEEEAPEEPQDSKAMLRALIADAVGSDADSQGEPDDAQDQTRQSSMGEDSNSMERVESRQEHPLIVIPSYMKQDMIVPDDHADYEDSRRMINIEVEPYNTYQSPNASQALSDQELIPGELGLRPRKACNCTKSQCLKLYCDCFANGEFCNSCNCANCHNNLENEELRQKAIRGCLDRNPNAFRPKIGKSKTGGPEHIIRRHNKGCNCKRSGCLKNYCECYEAKIACSHICKCVGCRNVEETLQRSRRARARPADPAHLARSTHTHNNKQPCSFMTTEVIEAVCQCLIAAAVEADGEGGAGAAAGGEGGGGAPRDPLRDVIDEFARCLQDIISASHHAAPLPMSDIEA